MFLLAFHAYLVCFHIVPKIITKLTVPIAFISVAFHLNRHVESLATIEDSVKLEQKDRDGSQVWIGRDSRADWR